MKRFLSSILFVVSLLATPFLVAQNTTTITGTVTDSDSQAWLNASYIATLVNPGGGTAKYLDGTTVPVNQFGVLNGAGAFSSASLPDNSKIVPFGTQWRISVCPVTSSDCQTVIPVTISGTTQNVGTFLSGQITAPRIPASSLVYAYNATEIVGPVNGNGYINTVSAATFMWNGAWTMISGGGGAVFASPCLVYALSSSTSRCGLSFDLISLLASGSIGNAKLVNPSMTINTATCTLGGVCNLPFLGVSHLAGMSGFYDNLPGHISGGVIQDQSGSGNNATFGTTPPVSITNGLQFGPTGGSGNTTINFPSAVNNTRTFQWCDDTQPYSILASFGTYFSASSSASHFPVFMQGGATPGFLSTYNGVPALGFYDFPNSTTTTYTQAYHPTGLHCKIVTLGTGGGDLDHFYYDGIEVSPYGAQVGSAGLLTSGNLVFGSAAAFPGASFNGINYEIILRPAKLTGSDAVLENAAMYSDMALRGLIPNGVNWSSYKPIQICVGDSICAGYLTSNGGWFNNLPLNAGAPSYTLINLGNPGKTSDGINYSTAQNAKQYCSANAGANIAFIDDGTNNFTGPIATALSVSNDLANQVQQWKVAGCNVFVATMISRGNAGGATGNGLTWAQNKNALNALIRTYAKSWGAVGIIDFDDPLAMADAANTNLTYFAADQVHPTDALAIIMGTDASNAVRYFTGATKANPSLISSTTYQMLPGDGYSKATIAGAATWTLPSCLGATGASYSIINTTGFTISIKNSISTQPINGVDYSTTALQIGGIENVFTVFPSDPSTGGCSWTRALGTSISNIVVTLPTSAISANTCTSVTTATMTNLVTTSVFDVAFATDPSAVTGWGANGGLTFTPWPTANTLNWKVCNQSTASITPGAMNLNVGAR